MKRSALVDGLLLTAVVASTVSLFALLRAIPQECPTSSPGQIEQSLTPCLASSRDEFDRAPLPATRSQADANTPVAATTRIAPEGERREVRRLDDIETTGSVR